MAWFCFSFGVIAVVFSVCLRQGLASCITHSTPEPGACEMCDTKECVHAAAHMLSNMNLSADPCEDFNEFACGRFIKETRIPSGWPMAASYTVVVKRNTAILRSIILKAYHPSDPKYLRNLRRFYRSCMDEGEIEAVGLEPYFNDTKFSDDWPTLNPLWSEANFDLNEVIARYMTVGVEPIFSISVGNDMNDSTVNVIKLLEGVLGLTQEALVKERNDTLIMAYEKYLAETAIALNASIEVAQQDAKDVVDLLQELASIMVLAEDKRDPSKLNNPVSLKNVNTITDKLDIARALRAAFDTAGITLPDNEKIINLYPTYMRNLSSVLEKFSNRTIQNLFGFEYAVLRVAGITQKMRNIEIEYQKVATGATASPRRQVCIKTTSEAFGKALSKQFVLRQFPETAKTYLNTMIDDLMTEFRAMIGEATWMSNKTKVGAFAKLASMKRIIGYPDEGFQNSDIERFYENYTMKKREYYNNLVVWVIQDRVRKLKSLRQPSSKNERGLLPHEVNAGYNPNQNQILFLAGILQPPLFVESNQHYINYGLMGFLIGHEITHGFDDQGSQYDKDGNLQNWWTEEDRLSLGNRTQCIIDQNSNTTVEEVNINLNGKNTLGETMADRGGLKEAFRAYQKKVKKLGKELLLPGFELTQDQLFFLSFAQTFCEKYKPAYLKSLLGSDTHPPGKYRINGALQNSDEFAKAYNCHPGSFMNPAEKCSVW